MQGGGAKYFVTIGTAGALQKNLKIGDIIIPEKAVRDEGTSYHYSKSEKYSYASSKISKALENILKKNKIKFYQGVSWTTDAPYRETIRKAKKYQQEGVLCMDMEASALFSIAKYRKVELGALFCISDSLADLAWNPQFYSGNVSLSKKKILEIALEALSEVK